MGAGDTDPRAVRSIAVTTGDVVTAYEARRRSARRPVLRILPPFAGRMRARLHAESESERATDVAEATGAVHVPPNRLVDETLVPSYPTPDDTEDSIRSNPDETFSVEHHHDRQVEAVAEWRAAVADALVGSVELRLENGPHCIAVKTLG